MYRVRRVACVGDAGVVWRYVRVRVCSGEIITRPRRVKGVAVKGVALIPLSCATGSVAGAPTGGGKKCQGDAVP